MRNQEYIEEISISEVRKYFRLPIPVNSLIDPLCHCEVVPNSVTVILPMLMAHFMGSSSMFLIVILNSLILPILIKRSPFLYRCNIMYLYTYIYIRNIPPFRVEYR